MKFVLLLTVALAISIAVEAKPAKVQTRVSAVGIAEQVVGSNAFSYAYNALIDWFKGQFLSLRKQFKEVAGENAKFSATVEALKALVDEKGGKHCKQTCLDNAATLFAGNTFASIYTVSNDGCPILCEAVSDMYEEEESGIAEELPEDQ